MCCEHHKASISDRAAILKLFVLKKLMQYDKKPAAKSSKPAQLTYEQVY